MNEKVLAVSSNPTHSLTKPNREKIVLLAGLGVECDAHMGSTVKHRSRVARDPSLPNLRQVHLIHSELFDQLRSHGYFVHPGQMGENITTQGIVIAGGDIWPGDSISIELPPKPHESLRPV